MLAEFAGIDGVIAIIVVAVLLFGGAAIPKLARNLGSAKSEFEKGLKTGKEKGSTDDGATSATSNSASNATSNGVVTDSAVIPTTNAPSA
jgi:Sec-independent protein translocase protein TatA